MEEKKGLWGRITNSRLVRFFADSIRNKLLGAFLLLSIPILVILGIVSYTTAANSLTEEAFNRLRAVETIKTKSVTDYFDVRRRDLQNISQNLYQTSQDAFSALGSLTQLKRARILDAFKVWQADALDVASDPDITRGTSLLASGFRSMGASRVRGLYLGKAALEDAADSSDYTKEHRAQHNFFAGYVKLHGFQDAYLIDRDGNVVYSVNKDDAFATNLTTGAFKDSGLAKLYQQLKSVPPDKAWIADLALYGNEYALFIGAPIYDGNTQVGILAYRLPISTLNAIVQDRTGFGKTGETYLAGKVGDKLVYRSDRVVKTGKIGDERPDKNYTTDALAGKAVTDFEVGSTGAYEVATAYPLQFLNLNWAIISTESVAELMAPTPAGQQKDIVTQMKERYAYHDIMLFSPDGYMFFSVAKESDLYTNLLTGIYKATNHGKLIDDIIKTKTLQISNVERYAPSNAEPAAFLGSPILNAATGEVDLIVTVQLNLDELSALMQERTGLGNTGETYLVSSDKLFYSNSRFAKDLGVTSTILEPKFKVDTIASQSALAGKSGYQQIKDYRGVDVLSVWSPYVLNAPTPIHPEGIALAVIAEVDAAEILAPVQTMALTTIGLVVFAILLVVVAAYFLARALVRQINAIMRLFSQIGIGEFGARTPVLSTDELGTMATSLNAMLDNTLTLIQSREQRESIQNSIMSLLDEVSGVAAGDLSKEATVTAEMTGAIADAFNYMIAQLRQIISRVQDTTLQVSSAAGEIQTTAEHLAQGSETQAQQIVDTSAALEEMAVSIQQVSDNAILSNTVAEQALNNAKRGTQAVQETMGAMNRIRDQVQETSKRIKRLGESSQEISEIVRLIDDIADRTSILALNASIQAAMAGEAGRGFAIVAEEVERLAERSTSATRQIETLVKTIQGETNETVAAMEDSTREVVEGSKLANQAGQALSEIEGVSSRLAELIQSISLASKQQARGAETLSQSMTDISQVTQQTAAGTKQAAVSINNLAVLAEDLRSSVSTFKLPTPSQN
ncbi:MAG: HAMP domain-containing protein [Chloroflexi bacterium]|nr:HAMP domain-containing protein [Chloroflexota bacterium]